MKTMRPESEAPIPPDFFGELWDDIKSCELRGDQKTCLVRKTPNGTTITVLRPPPASAGGGASDAGYTGEFLVVDASTKTGETVNHAVRIVNGANPSAELCGGTDLGDVAAKTISYEPPASGVFLTVYLTAIYISNKYKLEIIVSSAAPVSPTGYWVLARIDSQGQPSQVWTDGTIYFATRYYT